MALAPRPVNKRISELEIVTELDGQEFTLVVKNGATRRIPLNSIFNIPEGVSEAPKDGKEYIRKDGAWVEKAATNTDRYDLKVSSATAVLDLAQQQIFSVSATTNRTLSFANAPDASRAMTVVIELQGTGGTITWPTVSWSGGAAPTLGPNFTVVVLLWTGSRWVGSVAISA